MKDSGSRRTFSTGAVRDRAIDKPRPDLISPFATMRKGVWYGKGSVKYKPRNWEKGMPISECVASIWRHLLQYMMGDTSEDHVAAMGTNSDFIMHYEEMIKLGLLPEELDDLPKPLLLVEMLEEAMAANKKKPKRKPRRKTKKSKRPGRKE